MKHAVRIVALVVLGDHQRLDLGNDVRVLGGDVVQLRLVLVHIVQEEGRVVLLGARRLEADGHAGPLAKANILAEVLGKGSIDEDRILPKSPSEIAAFHLQIVENHL